MASGINFGAIRFDPWYAWTNWADVMYQEQGVLAPSQWQSRAPWFTSVISPYAIQCAGTQANMDLECTIANANGIKYWAFDSYQHSSGDPQYNANLSISWNLYQASANKSLVKWCWIMNLSMFGAPTWGDNSWQPYMTTLAQQMQQSNYMTVLAGRPLIYIIWRDSDVTSYFAGSNANVATTLTYLRNQCSGLGIGNPYIVLISLGTPSISTLASRRTTVGADAISLYTSGSFTSFSGTLPNAWSVLDAGTQSSWASMVATGAPTIPCGITGWDLRPRIMHPEIEFSGFVPTIGNARYFTLPTDAQVATHLQALVTFVGANAAACPSGAALIYSWSECAEGGNGLIPTIGKPPVGNTTSLLTAIAPVIT